MGRQGWIDERRGEDRRARLLRLSKTGRAQFKRALPFWEKAQTKLERQLGDRRWNDLLKLSNEVKSLVMETGGLQ
jgi:DNA-binding MarR family transcriptional regulator